MRLYHADTSPPDPFHTCSHPYHDRYSERYLPPILFRLDPLPYRELRPVENLVENGRVVLDDLGAPIRNFPFLPRYISVHPPGWLLEFWLRTDGRLSYKDIRARMTAPVHMRPKDNTLNMRRERDVRVPLGLSCWNNRRGLIARIEVERAERWTLDQLNFNTTMDIVYWSPSPEHPLPLPRCLRSKTLTRMEEPRYYRLDTFLGYHRPHIPSERVLNTVGLFNDLSERARELSLPSWRYLPAGHLPLTWKPMNHRAIVTSEASLPATRTIHPTLIPVPAGTPTQAAARAFRRAMARLPPKRKHLRPPFPPCRPMHKFRALKRCHEEIDDTEEPNEASTCSSSSRITERFGRDGFYDEDHGVSFSLSGHLPKKQRKH